MKSLLLRNGSLPRQGPAFPASPKLSLSRRDSVSGDRNSPSSPRVSLNLEINCRKNPPIRRTVSATEISGGLNRLLTATSRSFPSRIPEEDYVLGDEEDCGSWNLSESRFWPEKGVPMDGEGIKSGGDGRDHGDKKKEFGSDGERRKMSEYYEEMLKSNPGDSLLLRNYAKFLYEVEGEGEKAEEYYGRSILANPGDGEVLSLYGKLIWDIHRDEDRAKSYFDLAISASPDDCVVMGSYASFMWEAEEEEERSVLAPAMAAVL